jgi:hypothetical protein
MEDIRKGVCPLCRHNEVIEGPVRDLSPTTRLAIPVAAYAAGFTYTKGRGPDAMTVHGPLTHYACRRCGYMQTFASDAASIPIDDAHATRLLKGPSSAGPYR